MDKQYAIAVTRTGVIYAGAYKNSAEDTIEFVECRRVLLVGHSTATDIIMGRDITGRKTPAISNVAVTDIDKQYLVAPYIYGIILGLPDTTSVDAFKADYKTMCLSRYLGYKVEDIEGYPVAIITEHGRFRKGLRINNDLSAEEGYGIFYGACSAFAETMHLAFDKVQALVLNYQIGYNEPKNFADFVLSRYPDVDAPIPCLELIMLHNKITNSCTDGIKEFCQSKGINLHKEYSMRYFLTVVKDAYSSDKIQLLADKYGITI